jgi:hypothetical protein
MARREGAGADNCLRNSRALTLGLVEPAFLHTVVRHFYPEPLEDSVRPCLEAQGSSARQDTASGVFPRCWPSANYLGRRFRGVRSRIA